MRLGLQKRWMCSGMITKRPTSQNVDAFQALMTRDIDSCEARMGFRFFVQTVTNTIIDRLFR